ncbi:glucosyltransferase domain-containing protein [Maridesulfovibrio salexigens]|uniref:Glucosyl transferase GtrII n=1 Tax=Maridesulfovibrio salexigens (strain ATCC 14822 / DSM 2638 / NCIMB 8403 / VKM B-1763) TaxID=526222 RepID=C6BU07_MARSD|nr:glucosyltransferase domain-containing protein [Maridesulfovibrio salexigens]ACS81716.1 hypothetical protein Desal_3670 [Maridesulfovibrio salexigens DSM 2638]
MNIAHKFLDFDVENYVKEKYSNISKSDLTAFLITLFLGFCIHGAAMVNFFINEDFQLSGYIDLLISGRFLYGPVYNITNSYPLQFLHTFIFIFLASLSGTIIAKLLSAKTTFIKVLIAVIFLSYPAFAIAMTYNLAILVYAVSSFTSVLAVYFANKEGKTNFFCGALILSLSLAIYQTYLCVSASLCTAILLKFAIDNNLGDNPILKLFFKKAVRFIAFGISAGLIYIVLVKTITYIDGTPLSTYQGADQMGALSLSIFSLQKIFACYSALLNNSFFKFQSLLQPSIWVISLIACATVLYKQRLYKSIKDITVNLSIIVVVFVTTLIAAIIIPIVAPFSDITYMQTYGAVIVLCATIAIAADDFKLSKNITILMSIIIVVCFTTRTNAQYYRAHLITQASTQTVSRIFSRIEETPGFSSDKKLAIIGNLPNQYFKTETAPPFSNEGNSGYSGNFVGLSRANQSHKFTTILSVLGYKIAPILDQKDVLEASTIALRMPTYPQKGSIITTDKLIVVKLNDPLLVISPTSLGKSKYTFKFTPFDQSGNLEIVWQVIARGSQGQTIQTPTPELSITLDKPGETYCVIAHYRKRGMKEFTHSKPHWFIAN